MFSNPYDHSVEELETISGQKLDPARSDHFYVLLNPRLKKSLNVLEKNGIRTIEGLSGEDRHLFTAAGLFLIYDDCIEELDELIDRQIKHSDVSQQVPFSKRILFELGQMGFDEKHSARYFSLFYQLRRAYLFINRELSGEAPCIKHLRRELWNNIFTSNALLYVDNLWNRMEDFSTLLLGETGTGKGAAAKAIGRSGLIPFDATSGIFKSRFTDAFVSINLLEFPETLLESELFGHAKGAFTGASTKYDGLFKRCDIHGALFLDEIGDTNTSIQIKLLKVLQERQFTPVGTHESCRFSGRVIAATNRDVDQLRSEGEFRDDFYYRLSSDVIRIPSLSKRLSEDANELAVLVGSLLTRMMGKPSSEITQQIVNHLETALPANYHWPGNVRELEQAVRRTLLGREYKGENKAESGLPLWVKLALDGELNASDLLGRYCQSLYERHGTYEQVAKITQLDRRTVRKYVNQY